MSAATANAEKVLAEVWECTDLADGLAGIGLNLLHFAELTGDRALLDDALAAASLVAERLGGPSDAPLPDGPPTSGRRNPPAGLMRGASGSALLFIKQVNRGPGARACAGATVRHARTDARRSEIAGFSCGSCVVSPGDRIESCS